MPPVRAGFSGKNSLKPGINFLMETVKTGLQVKVKIESFHTVKFFQWHIPINPKRHLELSLSSQILFAVGGGGGSGGGGGAQVFLRR